MKILAIIITAILFSACATPISSYQKRELQFYQSKGLLVEEKNPAAAAALGFLPGFGSFYVREYGVGVVNLLFYPLSIFWDPVSGYDGATAINYYASKDFASRKLKSEIRSLDNKLVSSEITKEEYVVRKREIEADFSLD